MFLQHPLCQPNSTHLFDFFLLLISVHSKTQWSKTQLYCLLGKQSPDPLSRQQTSLQQSLRNTRNTIEWALGSIPANTLTPRLVHAHICTLTAHKRLSYASSHTHCCVLIPSYTYIPTHMCTCCLTVFTCTLHTLSYTLTQILL